MFTYCFFGFKAPKTFVAFHPTLPMLQKKFNSIKELETHGVFGVRRI
jgi:hypothetical protein